MCCDQKPSPSRPPTPHDRRVVPTFAGRPLVAFTLPPRQDEPWPEGRSTFPGNPQQDDSLNTEPSQLRQKTSLIQLIGISTLSSHPPSAKNARKSESLLCSVLHCRLALTITFASLALSYRACIYCIGLPPYIGLWPHFWALPRIDLRPSIYCIGFRPNFWAFALHRASAQHLLHRVSAQLLGFCPASGFGPAFTASGFGPTFGLLPCIGLRPSIYCIGFRPNFWAFALHRASAQHLLHRLRPHFQALTSHVLLSSFGPASTAFGLRPRIYSFRASALHVLLLGSGPAFIAFWF
ncbi:hypothetical protein CRG98_037302 [Punica granatum]|uniref:Uncharacterized protein n=1 Tax=Punica granatum TaxID=22663 RepID=A0A2I0IG14_PUNGR|nr:hypothetical protein CRG98_037302 [Punica granatum]